VLFNVVWFKNIVPTPIELIDVPAPIIPEISLTVCPTTIPDVVTPVILTDVVAAIPAEVAIILNPEIAMPVVFTPDKIWSALASMIATLIPFAQEPGFLAATVTPVIVFSSYPSSS
jgi:hypothetical protein